MAAGRPQSLCVGTGAGARRIAYLRDPGRRPDTPGVFWLCGFKSQMTSTKASALAAWARRRGIGCVRFDYSGHGQSEGVFEEGTVGRWLEEAHAVFRLSRGPLVLVGSSMGGYIALLLLRELLAKAPRQARRVVGAVLIAPAWNMTELLWKGLSASARRQIAGGGVYLRPSRYGDGPYPIARALIVDGRRHLLGRRAFDPGRPVHILHGRRDADVPLAHTRALLARLRGNHACLRVVRDGDHRLSRPQDIALLLETVAGMVAGEKAARR